MEGTRHSAISRWEDRRPTKRVVRKQAKTGRKAKTQKAKRTKKMTIEKTTIILGDGKRKTWEMRFQQGLKSSTPRHTGRDKTRRGRTGERTQVRNG